MGATITPLASPGYTRTPATSCASLECVRAAEHFWLERPIPPDYVNDARTRASTGVERTYPYGSTQGGLREPHHGVEFVNRSGTLVVAAAPGTVIAARNDAVIAYGPALDFYGNLVVVRLDNQHQYHGQPVYTLYGHLQEVLVKEGQQVTTGDELGTVGFTGIAIGPHLHFEVRVGENDYLSTRNPELWLKPHTYNNQPWGVIAGRVVDTAGNLVSGLTVVVRPVAIDYDVLRNHYFTTYEQETLNGDDRLQENFAIGDLPLGTYTVSVNTTKPYQQTVTVEAGHIAWVTFVVNPPYPTETPTPTP